MGFFYEARKGAEDLQTASGHHEQRDGVHPVAKADHEWVFIHRFCYFSCLHVFDCNRASCHSHRSALQTIEFRVALIFPVARPFQYMAHFEVGEILCLLVANLRGNAQTQRSAVFARQRLAVHFVAEQRLRMHGGRHVERLVIVICAFDGHEAGGRISADHLEEIGEARAAEPANHVPSLDANMPCVLRTLGQGLNLRESVLSRLLYRARHRESPLVEIHLGVIDVVVVNRELIERVSSESANVGAKWPERKSLAEAQSLKPRPPLRSGFCNCGMAKAPSAITGVSFNNSRRLMVLNLRLSVREYITVLRCRR